MRLVFRRICEHHFRWLLRKSNKSSSVLNLRRHNHHVCIVGSGPAGFYTAQQLLKGNQEVKVDIYEKLPVPFGLVRYGVAPDHPEVKNVIHTFTQTAKNDRCSFIGNVTVGQDVTVEQLRQAYSAVILSYGANDDRNFGIPGEDLDNIVAARNFVGWFNGLPQDKDLEVNLDVESAVILGQGNVALDVARILLLPLEELQKTDISQHALEALKHSKIKKVYIVGRRGPLQVAFTIKELREMIKLSGTRPLLHTEDFKDLNTVIKDVPRQRKRLMELMYKTCMEPTENDINLWKQADREWELKFLRSPVEFLGTSAVSGVRCAVNRLEGDNILTQTAARTNDTEDISCGLVLKSIGYTGETIEKGIPFDVKKGVISNIDGRVTDMSGVYCSGWISGGPVGVILTTMTDGFETGKLVLKDLADGKLDYKGKDGKSSILSFLKSKGVQVVSFDDWEKIDKFEIEVGQLIGKPREKLVDINHMLSIAAK